MWILQRQCQTMFVSICTSSSFTETSNFDKVLYISRRGRIGLECSACFLLFHDKWRSCCLALLNWWVHSPTCALWTWTARICQIALGARSDWEVLWVCPGTAGSVQSRHLSTIEKGMLRIFKWNYHRNNYRIAINSYKVGDVSTRFSINLRLL